jgi:hypothetical protein
VYSSFYSPLLAPPTSSLFLLLRPSLSRDISLSLHASTGTVPCDALSTETAVPCYFCPQPTPLAPRHPLFPPQFSAWLVWLTLVSHCTIAPRPAAGSRPLQFWWRLNLRTYTAPPTTRQYDEVSSAWEQVSSLYASSKRARRCTPSQLPTPPLDREQRSFVCVIRVVPYARNVPSFRIMLSRVAVPGGGVVAPAVVCNGRSWYHMTHAVVLHICQQQQRHTTKSCSTADSSFPLLLPNGTVSRAFRMLSS